MTRESRAAKTAAFALSLVVFGGWFACGQSKSSKSSQAASGSSTETASETASATASDTASASATDTSTATKPAEGDACTLNGQCALTKSCDPNASISSGSCIEAKKFTCCAECDCSPVDHLENYLALCVEGVCKAQLTHPAESDADCKDPKPTDKGDVRCYRHQCNNAVQHFSWQTPEEAAEEDAACKPCPNC